MDKLLEVLREFDALRDGGAGKDVVHRRSLPAVAPAYADSRVFDSLTPRIAQALRRCGVDRLYQHQAEAIEQALKGSNVVLHAPTAGGKTLAFQVPMIEALREPGAHALMIYPNKALALDQREQLIRLTEEWGSRIESWWYDGDTDKESRDVLRKKPPSILITNPDMLHNSFLGHADKWSRFYRGLKWVIVDEMHEYRGYFGSNVAMILRRFSHHLASQSIHPQLFLSSATCANAKEHAENLTGRPFVEINAAGSMRPHREFVFVQPDIPDYKYWEILQLRAVKAGLACLAGGKSVLVFCPTRKFAEACYRTTMRELEKLDGKRKALVDAEAIKVFRSGLSVEERHSVQIGLKSGAVRLVFTTNALEMGIDIGGLDGIIMAGFPDSMMSAWQRIGRAGRSWDAQAFVLYYARNNPLERFYAENLDGFLRKPLDDLVVNPENEDLVEKHLPSLLFETPDLVDSGGLLGAAMSQAARKKLSTGARPAASGQWRPHSSLNIRGGGAGAFILKEGNNEIGTLSGHQQFREAYQRAIYMHAGRTYRVKEISLTGSGGEIMLESVDTGRRTNAATFTSVTEQDIYDGRRWETNGSRVNAFYGKVLIMEALNSIQEIDERTGEIVDQWVPQANSAKFDNVHAFWVREEDNSDFAAEGIGAFQQLLRVGALFSIPLDAHDIYSHSVAKEQKAYIVESYPGGIGIAKKVLERWQSVLKVGIRIAEQCKCARGCPNCIVPPRSKNDLDKVAGISFAQAVLGTTAHRPDFEFRNGLWEPAT